MDNITVGDYTIPCVFVQKPWIRNTYLRFEDEKLVVVSRNQGNAMRVLDKHHDWIMKHYSQIKSSVRMFSTSGMLFNGTRMPVRFTQHYGRPRVEISGDSILVLSRSNDAAERALERWLSRQTILATESVACEKACAIGKAKPSTRTRRFRKWGVCRSNNTITFNTYVCMLPAELRDYIISHEVAHLAQMNHSRRFWEVVGRLCPEYRILRKRLKNYDSRRRPVFVSPAA